MVDSILTTHLSAIGFSDYEGRAYIALLGAHPCTAYEVARESGIPSSKIYGVLSKLLEKRVVSVLAEGATKRYIPIDPDELIESHRHRTEASLEGLKKSLGALGTARAVSTIWNIDSYDHLMEKARRMILGARETVLLSVWREELAGLAGALGKIRKRTKVAIVHFGTPDETFGQTYPHPIAETLYREKGGRGMTLVVDSREALIGTAFPETGSTGAWSTNQGFVTVAEDYIKHDIYIMKIVKRFDGSLKKTFGEQYALLRDVFHDEEAE